MYVQAYFRLQSIPEGQLKERYLFVKKFWFYLQRKI